MEQIILSVPAGMSSMAAGAWLGWPDSALPQLQQGIQGFTLQADEISLVVSLMDLGNILSPVPSGYAMDAIGRKFTLYSAAVMYLAASVCALCAYNVWWLYFARLFAGLGKGVACAVAPIYLAEVAKIEFRGALITMFIGMLNVGLCYVYVFASFTSLLAVNIANLVVPVVFATALFFSPESSYYLLMKRRETDAKKSLIKCRNIKKEDVENNRVLEEELKTMQINVEIDMKNRARFWDLFATPGSRRALLIISSLALFQRGSGISPTLAYSSMILPKNGGGLSTRVYMIIFSVIFVIANYVSTPLIDRWGRRPLLLTSSISTGVVSFIASVYYYLERETELDVTNIKWIPYASLIMFSVTYSIGLALIPSTAVELFPTNLKSYAGSVSTIILASTSFIVNKIFYGVSVNWGPHIMYWGFTIIMIISTVFTYFVVFETKGKSFAEIQNILNSITDPKHR